MGSGRQSNGRIVDSLVGAPLRGAISPRDALAKGKKNSRTATKRDNPSRGKDPRRAHGGPPAGRRGMSHLTAERPPTVHSNVGDYAAEGTPKDPGERE